jgi:hypothetical protein
MIFFFLSHIIIVLLIFRQPLIEDFNLGRKIFFVYNSNNYNCISTIPFIIAYDIKFTTKSSKHYAKT